MIGKVAHYNFRRNRHRTTKEHAQNCACFPVIVKPSQPLHNESVVQDHPHSHDVVGSSHDTEGDQSGENQVESSESPRRNLGTLSGRELLLVLQQHLLLLLQLRHALVEFIELLLRFWRHVGRDLGSVGLAKIRAGGIAVPLFQRDCQLRRLYGLACKSRPLIPLHLLGVARRCYGLDEEPVAADGDVRRLQNNLHVHVFMRFQRAVARFHHVGLRCGGLHLEGHIHIGIVSQCQGLARRAGLWRLDEDEVVLRLEAQQSQRWHCG
mmetsp:Transcript_48100/g.127347  ORF Transcript_48100/g.127347 Transcript_48100/m.127347 type:complete len:266 (-) Transcript_48100:44-841(-)